MENGLWKEKQLVATDVAKSYELEKAVRKGSAFKELRCPDPDCHNPILRYCHGEKKDAFFAHLNNEHCDYADFDRINTQIIRNIRTIIYQHFRGLGYQVRPEVKVLEHHYTHLLFDMVNEKKVAVEIGTQRLSATHIDNLTEEYQKKDIAVKWIVVDNTEGPVHEDQTYYIKRYLLNESANKDLLVITYDCSKITQYRADTNNYEYNGIIQKSENYPDIYEESASIDDLIFENNELSLKGFTPKYKSWIGRKRAAFNKKIAQLEEASQKGRQLREWVRRTQQSTLATHSFSNNQSQNVALPERSQTNSPYDQRRNEILPYMNQQESQVHDSIGIRWVRCERCGAIETDDKFASYGGIGHINLGLCNCCRAKDRNK